MQKTTYSGAFLVYPPLPLPKGEGEGKGLPYGSSYPPLIIIKGGLVAEGGVRGGSRKRRG